MARQTREHRHKKKIVRTLIFPTVLYGCETWTMTKKMEKRSTHVRCGYGGRCKEYHGRRRRRKRRKWMDEIHEVTGMKLAELRDVTAERKHWRRMVKTVARTRRVD